MSACCSRPRRPRPSWWQRTRWARSWARTPTPASRCSPGSAVSFIVGVAAKQATVPRCVQHQPFYGRRQEALNGAEPDRRPCAAVRARTRRKDARERLLRRRRRTSRSSRGLAGQPVPAEQRRRAALPAVGGKSAAAATAARCRPRDSRPITIPVLATDAPRVGNVVAQKPGTGRPHAKGSTVYLYTAPARGSPTTTAAASTCSSFGSTPGRGSALDWRRHGRPSRAGTPTGTQIAFIDRDDRPRARSTSPPPTAAQRRISRSPTGADYHRPVFAPLAGSDGCWRSPEWTGSPRSSLCFLDLSKQPARSPRAPRTDDPPARPSHLVAGRARRSPWSCTRPAHAHAGGVMRVPELGPRFVSPGERLERPPVALISPTRPIRSQIPPSSPTRQHCRIHRRLAYVSVPGDLTTTYPSPTLARRASRHMRPRLLVAYGRRPGRRRP